MRRWLMIAAVVCWTPSAWAQPWISGFVEGLQAWRIQYNPALDDSRSFGDWRYPRSEVRAQLQLSGGGDRDEYFVRMDFVSDRLHEDIAQFDLREAYLKLYLADWVDLKIGRQVATWGTGDLLFANDLFAKDWVAFFTGLDIGYLKLPQDLLRLSFYLGRPALEIALSPYYTMDNLPAGERLSMYNPFLRRTVGSEGAPAVIEPDRNPGNGEIFARLFGLAGGLEWAFYGYRGFFPQPLGAMVVDSVAVLFAPSMWSGGASLRGSWGGFLLNGEGALYYSEDDADGSDPMLPNSSIKLLAGAERSLGNDLTAGAQWFGDLMMDYDGYRAAFDSVGAEPMFDELRHTVTLRLTKFLKHQTIRLSFFGYWGISDQDVYLRPYVDWSVTDAVKLTAGFNWVDGNEPYTMFGQFRNNSNVHLRARYSF